MRSQLPALLRNELVKAARRKLPYFGFLAVGLLSLLIYFIAGKASNASNAWGYIGFSMQLTFTDIGPIFVIVFAAMLLAEETGNGTIRAALAAPVHRWELYLAKAVTAMLYMIAITTAALVYAAALARLHYSFGAVGDSFGVVYSPKQAIEQLVAGYALSWIPLGALALYGLLISTLIRSPGAAVAVGISTVFLIDFTKHLVGLDPYIFTRYITYSWVNVQQLAQGMEARWQPEVWRMAWLCGVSGMITFVVGLIVFTREDLNH
jgi:ABC-type transport system involved in multi-copper enzyme maturation permease subunit